jgi:predicted nucleotidyltransferase
MATQISISSAAIADFCRQHRVRRLALFGSALRADFRPDSDVDLLVEFLPGHVPVLIYLSQMEMELSQLLRRRVDLRTAQELSPDFRSDVLAAAEDQYVAQ